MNERKFWRCIAYEFRQNECDWCVVCRYAGENPKYEKRCHKGCDIAIKHVYEHIRRTAKRARKANDD